MPDVKRLQIMIDEDLDAALDRLALKEGTSKAALIRRFVRQHVEQLPPLEEDPLWQMVGAIDISSRPPTMSSAKPGRSYGTAPATWMRFGSWTGRMPRRGSR